MLVRRKQSIACAGVLTIGSFSLNEVLIRIGTPVSSPKRFSRLQYSGLTSRSTVCRRPVPSSWVTAGIRSRWCGLDLVGLHHERRRIVGLEVLAGRFGEHRRAERAERLAELDALVQGVLHVRAARVGEDAAAAQRARAELHAALEPADDLAVGQLARGAVDQLALRRAGWYSTTASSRARARMSASLYSGP